MGYGSDARLPKYATFDKAALSRSVALALLWQFRFAGVGEEFFIMRASPGWRLCEEVEDRGLSL